MEDCFNSFRKAHFAVALEVCLWCHDCLLGLVASLVCGVGWKEQVYRLAFICVTSALGGVVPKTSNRFAMPCETM